MALRLDETLKAVAAGLVIGTMSVVFALSFAAIVYAGPLAPFLGRGIGLTLIGAILMAATAALTLNYRGTIAGPQDLTALLLGQAAASVAGTAGLGGEAAFATVVVMIAIATIATGMAAFAMGALKLGFLARYIPFPVIGGFLAASAVLLVKGAFPIVASEVPGGDAPGLVAQWPFWLPWLAFGAALAAAARIVHSGFLVPIGLALAAFGFYAALALLGFSLENARDMGLLLGPFQDESFIEGLNPAILRQARWDVLPAQIPVIFAVVSYSLFGALLNVIGLELLLDRPLDINKDMKGVGLANMASGLGGGMPGYHLLGETLLAKRIGIPGAAAGLAVAVICAIGLFFGAGLLSNLPRGLLAAVIWFLGFDLLLTALLDHGRRMSPRDLALMLVTPLIAALFGFLPAMGFGLLAASLLFVIAYAQIDVVSLMTTGARLRARVERDPEDHARLTVLGAGIHIYKLSGFLFFGTAHRLLDRLEKSLDGPAPPQAIIIDLKRVVGLDLSAWDTFDRLARRCPERAVDLVFSGFSESLSRQRIRQMKARSTDVLQVAGDLDGALAAIEGSLLDGAAPGAVQQASPAHAAFAAFAGKHGERLRFAAGELVMAEGGAPDGLMLLLDGQLVVMVEDAAGKATTLNRLLPGALLGEVGFYAGLPRSASVYAEADSRALRISAATIARLARESPAEASGFHQALAAILATRLVSMTRLLKDADL